MSYYLHFYHSLHFLYYSEFGDLCCGGAPHLMERKNITLCQLGPVPSPRTYLENESIFLSLAQNVAHNGGLRIPREAT